jgi:hypothetical protein
MGRLSVSEQGREGREQEGSKQSKHEEAATDPQEARARDSCPKPPLRARNASKPSHAPFGSDTDEPLSLPRMRNSLPILEALRSYAYICVCRWEEEEGAEIQGLAMANSACCWGRLFDSMAVCRSGEGKKSRKKGRKNESKQETTPRRRKERRGEEEEGMKGRNGDGRAMENTACEQRKQRKRRRERERTRENVVIGGEEGEVGGDGESLCRRRRRRRRRGRGRGRRRREESCAVAMAMARGERKQSSKRKQYRKHRERKQFKETKRERERERERRLV